jgi:glycosyltransferase involved in cell wall biosynthesis
VDRFGRADIVHDNGIWRAHHHQIARLAVDRGIPRVVSTRGMLEPWAMRHKPFRKQLGWRFYQRRDLASAACHHATADAEAENLRRLGLRVPIRVIPNGVDMPDAVEKTKSAERHALFIGRIYPVKGLPMLIDAWARVRPHGWTLKIGGPDEAGHRREVEKGIEAAGLQGTVSFLGPVDGPMKQSALEAADLFVLPSHSESFGMAVAEALAHGLPVLTTTAAPWPMLTGRGCGWWVPPTVDGLTDGLRRATSTDPATLYEMGARGRAFVAAEFAWDNVAKQFIAMYEALARHAQPC